MRNPADQAVFDTFAIRPPIAKTKRECTLEALLAMTLPHLVEKELSTKTSNALRSLIHDIQEEIK